MTEVTADGARPVVGLADLAPPDMGNDSAPALIIRLPAG